MTVYRVGTTQQRALQHRVELGRVLVTIDDLDALIRFLKMWSDGRITTEIKIEFDGGYFTKAEELRTLSDTEMRSLRMHNTQVQVVLSPSAAFAVGEHQ